MIVGYRMAVRPRLPHARTGSGVSVLPVVPGVRVDLSALAMAAR